MQIQTVANALCPKDIERLSQSLPAAHTHLTEFRRTLISRWVEAYPTGRATAAHTAKCLVTDSFPDGDYQIALTQIKVPTSQDR